VCVGFVFGDFLIPYDIYMENNKRISIFIDGGNFHHLAIKKIGITENEFNFESFVDFLKENNTISENGKRFYIGTVREKEGDEASKKSMAKQTSLFAELKKYQWKLRTSKLKTRTETITVDHRMQEYKRIQKIRIKEIVYERKREKGIDVMLATDLIVGAVEDVYDIAIIISSDADLIPAIKWVRETKNKQIIYIGFSIADKDNQNNSSRPLSSMIQNTDFQRVLVEADLVRFIKQDL